MGSKKGLGAQVFVEEVERALPGQFGGSFVDPTAGKRKFKGIFIQDTAGNQFGTGFFPGTDVAGLVSFLVD